MKTEIIQPTVPNFLKVRVGNNKELVTVAVKDLSEEDLRAVGERFTEDLVIKAKRSF